MVRPYKAVIGISSTSILEWELARNLCAYVIQQLKYIKCNPIAVEVWLAGATATQKGQSKSM